MAEAESVLVSWARATFPDARVFTEAPANLEDVLPAIGVSRFGGADTELYNIDEPVMDFDCYAATRGEARTLAYDLRTALRRDLPGQTVAGAFVQRVRSLSGPLWTPYDNTNLRRFTYSAQIRLRSLEAA